MVQKRPSKGSFGWNKSASDNSVITDSLKQTAGIALVFEMWKYKNT